MSCFATMARIFHSPSFVDGLVDYHMIWSMWPLSFFSSPAHTHVALPMHHTNTHTPNDCIASLRWLLEKQANLKQMIVCGTISLEGKVRNETSQWQTIEWLKSINLSKCIALACCSDDDDGGGRKRATNRSPSARILGSIGCLLLLLYIN